MTHCNILQGIICPKPAWLNRIWLLPFGLALGLGLFGARGCSAPTEFCPQEPIAAPQVPGELGGGLAGFDSPYLGHHGSWDGMGGAARGESKNPDLDREVDMGLRWTFMPVYWSALEPDGPVDLSQSVPASWLALDAFVVEAERRGLNILMQAPVMGGNAGSPPAWAGLREPEKSAPLDMTAVADFAGKLANRYRPGGTLAKIQGWGERYGVRAWELDNEPDLYRTHWDNQAGDYAEFVTKVSQRIKEHDPLAVILTPAVSSSEDGATWTAQALDALALAGSPIYKAAGLPYSIGPASDVVSFHLYEGMDRKSIECVFRQVRSTFEAWEMVKGFEYARKQEYWHTEGNYDFFKRTSDERMAAWRWQFFSRAFAVGIRKVIVMDVTEAEQLAVKNFVGVLPNPFPMLNADAEVRVGQGKIWAYRHPDGSKPSDGQVWIVWAENGSSGGKVTIPVQQATVTLIEVNGRHRQETPQNGWLEVTLAGDEDLAPPILVVDRP
jgi:hypothetical protein